MSDVPDATSEDQWLRILDLLAHPDVVAYAQKQLRILGLHRVVEAADLLDTVLEGLHRQLAKGPIGDGAPNALRRYVFTAVFNTARKLLEADKRQRLAPREKDPWSLVAIDDPGNLVDAVTADPNDRVDVDWDRLRLLATDPPPRQKPWLTASVFAYLAASQGEDHGLPGRVRLPADPAPGQIAEWVALQYAGRNDCFVEPETPTIRKRRSDASGKLKDAVAPVIAVGLDRTDLLTTDTAGER